MASDPARDTCSAAPALRTMRASRAALQAAKAAMSFGPPTAPNAALLAARDAPKRRVLLCANSTVHGGCAPACDACARHAARAC